MNIFKFPSLWIFLLMSPIFLSGLTAKHGTKGYPKELHQQIIERLNRRRGSSRFSHGYWGSWSPWSDCSRSCGTGVSTQFRECHPSFRRKKIKKLSEARNGCVGRYKRFQLCNTQICPSGYTDIRSEQCSFYNKTPFNRRFYIWEPHIDKIDSCTLNCRAVGLGFYAMLNQTVIDGTPCGNYQERDGKICVGGQCMVVGCDQILGSGRQMDSCGVCGGRNNTCRPITGSILGRNRVFGYNFVFTLPPKAENVSVFHEKPSSSYLALRDLDGKYLLNGPGGLNGSGTIGVSWTKVSYEGNQVVQGDRIFIRGPLNIPIYVLDFYQGSSSGIKYEYMLPVSSGIGNNWRKSFSRPTDSGIVNDAISVGKNSINKHSHKAKDRGKNKHKYKHDKKGRQRRKRYMWIASGYTACSHTCGVGSQTTRIVCVKRRRKEIEAPPQLCSGFAPPHIETVRCNLRPCPYAWQAASWNECSVSCGFGFQKRLIKCTRKVTSNVTETVSESDCKDAEAVDSVQLCHKRECNGPPEWETGQWSKCSSQCGLGNRKRIVKCVSERGPVEPSMCKDSKPLDNELCDMGSCASDTWFASPWQGSCEGPCGEGSHRRRVLCSGNSFETPQAYSSSCTIESRPGEEKQCNLTTNCGGSWFAGPWSDCDAVTCRGSGQRRRMVVCMVWNRKKLKVAKNPSFCKRAGERPTDTETCSVICAATWFTSEWSRCSTSCGKGVKRREIKCLDGDNFPSLMCPSATKPDSRQSCNDQSCEDKNLTDNAIQNIPKDSPVQSTKDDKISNKTVQNEIEGSCMDRMKNCRLVYKARLCKLKYYNKLCCATCTQH